MGIFMWGILIFGFLQVGVFRNFFGSVGGNIGLGIFIEWDKGLF